MQSHASLNISTVFSADSSSHIRISSFVGSLCYSVRIRVSHLVTKFYFLRLMHDERKDAVKIAMVINITGNKYQ